MPHNLKKVVAAPQQTGVRNIRRENQVASRLNLGHLGAIFRRAENGDVRDLLTLAGQVERRDPHLSSQLQTRRMSILQAPWASVPSETNPNAEAHVELVTRMMELPTWRDLLWTMSDAIYRQYAVSEVIWETEGEVWIPEMFAERDQRWFKYHDVTGELVLRDDQGRPEGIPLEHGKFVIHTAPSVSGRPHLGGLMYNCTLWNLYKDLSMRNWLKLSEIWGIPTRVGSYDSATATSADIEALQQAIHDMGIDAGCVKPMSTEIEVLPGTGSSSGNAIYSDLLQYVDEAISKLVLGGTLNADVGGSEAQGRIHEAIRFDLLRGDLERMSSTLQASLVEVLIDLNFGPQLPGSYPSIVAEARKVEDLPMITEMISALHAAGVPLKMREIYERTGFSPPDESDDVLSAPELPQPESSSDPQAPGSNTPPS